MTLPPVLQSVPQCGERLAKNTELAAERGVFGSPTFIVGDDIFFGNDRLGFLEERLLIYSNLTG